MSTYNNLREIRLSHNLTQEELSKKIGISVVSIRAWEKGTKNPSKDAIIALANLYKVSSDEIIGLKSFTGVNSELTQEEATLLNRYRELDYYGKKSVKSICEIEYARVNKNIPTDISQKTISDRYIPLYSIPSAAGYSAQIDDYTFKMIPVVNHTPQNADFAVTIQGDSMLPYIQNNEIVYVKKTYDLSIGDIGIFCVDGAMYCKQYYKNNDGDLMLLSSNPRLQDANVIINCDSNSSVSVYGKVLMEHKIPLPDYLNKTEHE